MLFMQVKLHGDNFSYLVADDKTKQAAVIDSSFNADELTRIIRVKKLELKYIINTHGHYDHTACNSVLKSAFKAQIVAYKLSEAQFDMGVDDGDVLNLGAVPLKVLYTPGHSKDSICILVDDKKLLSGDTLFVGECGRTDLPGGDVKKMYDSLFNKIVKLCDEVEVYPGHDYGSKPSSTIGEEKKLNYTLEPRSLTEFVVFMTSS